MGPSPETPVRASSQEEQMKLEVDSRYTWRGGKGEELVLEKND